MTPEQTLRERWNEEWEKSANNLIQKELPFTVEMAKTGGYKIFDFFLAQFDAMLAEDIEKMDKRRLERNGVQMGLNEAVSILEARREALKK